MNKVVIITDTTCDLSLQLMAEYNIKFLPMLVDIGGRVFKDKLDISNSEFYEAIKDKNIFPKTAQISPFTFEETFKEELDKGSEIVCITISSTLSGTFSSANIAKDALGSNQIHIIDSKTVSLGEGYLVKVAAQMAEAGNSASEIEEAIKKLIEKQDVVIALDTMEMLKRGGRISPAKATIGGILGIKPILTITDGILEPARKAKGKKAAVKEMLQYLKDKNIDLSYTVKVAHVNDLEGCNKMVQTLKEEFGIDDIMTSEIGPAVATHAGPGGLAIFFIRK